MKQTDKIPHIVEIRIEMAVWQQLICSRIGWTELNYCDFQFVAGSDFIDKVLLQLEHNDKRILLHSAVFWGWWSNQWHSRNLELYNRKYLTPGIYRVAHTLSVQRDTFIINNFWSHIDAMIKDGSERLYGEAVK
jgi:hypothetical protein